MSLPGAGLFANCAVQGGSLDATVRYVGRDTDPTPITFELRGAAGTPFTVLSSRPEKALACFDLSGPIELGGGWSLGSNVNAVVSAVQSDIAARTSISLRF